MNPSSSFPVIADDSEVNSDASELPRFFGPDPDMSALPVVPDYEALSYTWGDEKVTTPIEINGVSFSVTLNLFGALNRLRKNGRDRVLWIDSICINQRDLVERSTQVRRMPFIYQRASRVVVWVGDGANDSDQAIDVLQRLGGKEKEIKCLDGFWRYGDWYGPQFDCLSGVAGNHYSEMLSKRRSESLRKLDLSTPVELSDTEWRALENFLLGSVYWSRAWIVQELTYARSVKLYYGRKSMGWNTFTGITHNEKLYNTKSLRDRNLVARFANMMTASGLTRLMQQQDEAKEYTRALGFEREGTSLLQQLVKFRNWKSTDPRDKVYALLGLPSISDDMYFHAPDYTMSPATVFQETTRSIIRYENCLHVICLEHPDPQPRPYDLPSWCPNWAQAISTFDSQPLIDVSIPKQRFRASGATIPQTRDLDVSGEDRTIRRGQRLTWAGTNMVLRGAKSFRKKDGFPHFNAYCVTIEESQDKTLVLDGVNCGNVIAAFPPVPFTTFENNNDEWKSTVLVWEKMFNPDALMSIRHHDPDGLPRLADFVWTILKGNARSPPMVEGIHWPSVLFEKYLIWSARMKAEDAKWTDLHHKLDSIDEIIKKNVRSWKFGLVGEGTMAMIPNRSCEGDVIAVLFGGDVPFVLRPIKDVRTSTSPDDICAESCYELIGTAYVHSDLMRGEIIELLDAGQKERTTFVLV